MLGGGEVTLMFKTNAVALHNPATRAVVELFETMKATVDELIARPVNSNSDGLLDNAGLLDRVAKRQGFLFSLERASALLGLFIQEIEFKADKGETLSFLLEKLEVVEANLASVKTALDKFSEEELWALEASGVPARPQIVFETSFRDFAALLQAVTPEHVAMESHYLKLIRDDVAFTYGDETKLFAPLAELRDRYFTAPTPTGLQEYLQLSETLIADVRYERYQKALFVAGRIDKDADLRADLASFTTELEVMSMLELITTGKSVRSHRA
jgi:hypothetical protein